MQTFVTSDLHFGHRGILDYYPATRGKYRTVENMTASMIAEWNASVQPGDLTYILGDVSFYSLPQTVDVLNALNGSKFLVAGNHDRSLVNRGKFKSCFTDIVQYYEFTYKPLAVKVCMCHYPMVEWYRMQDGSVMLHGHLHGAPSGLEEYRILDVGVDATGKVVSRLDDVLELALTKKIKPHGGV